MNNECLNPSILGRITAAKCAGENVEWRFVKLGSNYIIVSRDNHVIDNYAGSLKEGAPIHSWVRNNKINQLWTVNPLNGGKISLKSANSGKCLQREEKGNGYVQSTCFSKSIYQQFDTSIFVKKVSVSEIPGDYVQIQGKGNFCLHADFKKRVIQGPCNSKDSALWKFSLVGKEYVLQSKTSQALTVASGGKKNGDHILSWDRHDSSFQKWYYIKVGKNKFSLKSFDSGKCLDNTGKAANGIGYHQWSCSKGDPNQVFKFVNQDKSKTTSSPRKNVSSTSTSSTSIGQLLEAWLWAECLWRQSQRESWLNCLESS